MTDPDSTFYPKNDYRPLDDSTKLNLKNNELEITNIKKINNDDFPFESAHSFQKLIVEDDIEINIQTFDQIVKTEMVVDKKANENDDEKADLSKIKDMKKSKNKKKIIKKKVRVEKKTDLILKSIKKRKTVRIITIFIVFAIILIGTIFGSEYRYEKGNYSMSAQSVVNLIINNCTLNIYDQTGNTDMSLAYRVQNNPFGPKIGTFNSPSYINYQFEINNDNDMEYCYVNWYIKPNIVLNSLTIRCQTCFIIQYSQQINIQNQIIVQGNKVYANFINIQANTINATITKGYLAFNYLIVNPGTINSIVAQTDGDIILQTINGLMINYIAQSNTYCLSAPSTYTNTYTGNCPQNASCGSANLCTQTTCSNDPTVASFNIQSGNGNINVNIIPGYSATPTSTANLIQSSLTKSGIAFDSKTQQTLTNFTNILADTSYIDPIILLDLGYGLVSSSAYTKYTITSNPAYAYAKPWWLATFSASLLEPDIINIKGRLQPGFCPYQNFYSENAMYQIQTLAQNIVNNTHYVYAFIMDNSFSNFPNNSNGIYNFSTTKTSINDYWFTILENQGHFMLVDNNINSNTPIIVAFAVSLIFATFVSLLLVQIFWIALKVLFRKAIDSADHLGSYSELEKSTSNVSNLNTNNKSSTDKANKDKKPNQKDTKGEVSTAEVGKSNQSQKNNNSTSNDEDSRAPDTISEFLRKTPSVAALMDFIISLIYNQTANSPKEFYNYLFSKVPKSECDPVKNPDKLSLKFSSVKLYYEKFCFLNHFTEKDLQAKENQSILDKYGYTIQESQKVTSEVYLRLLIKEGSNGALRLNSNDITPMLINQDSLDIFMSNFVQITQFDADQTEVTYFEELYDTFCQLNALKKVVISTSIIKNKYQLATKTVPTIMLISKLEEDDDIDKGNFLTRCLRKTKYFQLDSKLIYKIDKDSLENHFKMLTNNHEKMTSEAIEKATIQMIIFPLWYLWDIITVLFHLFLLSFCTIPIILIVYLMEYEYSIWSMKDPSILITQQDLVSDPQNLATKMTQIFIWNDIILIITCIILCISVLDTVISYFSMDFPARHLFENSQKNNNIIVKIIRISHWILLFFSLAIYFGYIGLVLIWAILGAILNPNAFLPYASGAGTFVTFCLAKYNQFKNLFKEGKDALFKFILKLFSGVFSNIGKKLIVDLNKMAETVVDKSKEIIDSQAFSDVTSKMALAGLIDKDTINDIQTKISMLNLPKLAESGMNTAEAAMKNPMAIAKEADKLIEKLKQQTIDKIKEEAIKREIPTEIIDAAIHEVLGNTEGFKNALIQLLKKYKLIKQDLMIDLLGDIAFPKSVQSEEFIFYISEKISKIIMVEFKLEKIANLSPVILNNIIVGFDHMANDNKDAFNQIITNLLQNIPAFKKYSYIQQLIPLFDIIAKLMRKNSQNWIVRGPLLKFIENFCGPIFIEEKGASDGRKLLEKLMVIIDFIGLLLQKHELACDPRDARGIYDSKKKRKIIKSFLDLVARNTFGSTNANLIFYLVHITLIQPENDLPMDVVKDLEKLLELQLGPNKHDFLRYCNSLSYAVRHNTESVHQTIEKCQRKFSVDQDLAEFIRMVTYYEIEDLMSFERRPENNAIFQNIALTKLNIDVNELIGFLDLMFERHSKLYTINAFIKGICKKANIPDNAQIYLRSLFYIITSDNEHMIMMSANMLDLQLIPLLLAGKIGSDWLPYIQDDQFKAIDLKKSDISKNEDIIKMLNDKKQKSDAANQTDRSALTKNQLEIKNIDSILKFMNVYFKLLKSLRGKVITADDAKAVIDGLTNDSNKLSDIMNTKLSGATHSASEMLVCLVNLYTLNFGVRAAKLTKEQDAGISELANILKVNEDLLSSFISLFLLSESTELVNKISYLLTIEEEDKLRYTKTIDYCLDQVNTHKSQKLVIKRLSNKFNSSFSSSLFEKLLFDQHYKKLDTIDCLSAFKDFLKNFEIKNLKDVLGNFTGLALAINGEWDRSPIAYKAKTKDKQLDETTLSEDIGLKDLRYGSLCQIATIRERSHRINEMLNLFEYQHPLKNMLVWYAFLTNTPSIGVATLDGKMISLKEYLGDLYGIYEEFFEIFDHIQAKSISDFSKGITLTIQRLSKTTEIDNNLLLNVLQFINSEKFDTGNIAKIMELSTDFLDFVISIIRIRNFQLDQRKNDLNAEVRDFCDNPALNNICQQHRIVKNELTSILKLCTNTVEGDQEIAQILADLKVNNKVSVAFTKALLTLNQPINPRISTADLPAIMNKLEKEIRGTLNDLQLDPIFGLFMIRLMSGDIQAFQTYTSKLSWILPSGTNGEFMKLMLQGLCGICNTNVKVESKDDKYRGMSYEIKEFEDFLKNHKGTVSNQGGNNGSSKVIPNNSLAYAISCLYQSIGVPPCWSQAFLFDLDFYANDIPKRAKFLTKEFILFIVVNIINLPDHVKLALGCQEFLERTMNLMTNNINTASSAKFSKETIEKIERNLKDYRLKYFLVRNLIFKKFIRKCYDFLPFYAYEFFFLNEELGVDEQKVKKINQEINKSLVFLLMQIKGDILDKKQWAQFVKDSLRFPEYDTEVLPLDYLLIHIQNLKDNKTIDDTLKELQNEKDKMEKEEEERKKKNKEEEEKENNDDNDSNMNNEDDVMNEEDNKEDEEYGEEEDFNTNKSYGNEIKTENEWWEIICLAYRTLISDHLQDDKCSSYPISILSMLGTAYCLRIKNKLNYDYIRCLYNINSLVLHIERILYYESEIPLLPKFRIIKLLGLCIGERISNIVQFCLPSSLLDLEKMDKFTKSMNLSNTNYNDLLNKLNYFTTQFLNENQYNQSSQYEIECWAGPFVFNLEKDENEQYRLDLHEALYTIDEWEDIVIRFNLADKYLGNPDIGNFILDQGKITNFEDLEFIQNSMVDEEEVPDKYKKSVNAAYLTKSRLVEFQIKQNNEKDAYTENDLKVVKDQIFEFEINLFNPNMNIFMGIIKGQFEKIIDSSNYIGSKGDQIAEYYTGIIGLHSQCRIPNPEEIYNYIGYFSNLLTSDLFKVTEIIKYIYDGISCLNCLHNPESNSRDISELLLIWECFKAQKTNDRFEQEGGRNKKPEVNWSVVGLSEIEATILGVLIDCYNLRERGWTELIELLQTPNAKPDSKAKFLSCLLNFSALSIERNENNHGVVTEDEQLFHYVIIDENEFNNNKLRNFDMGDMQLTYIYTNLCQSSNPKFNFNNNSKKPDFEKILVSFFRGLAEADNQKLIEIIFPQYANTSIPSPSKKPIKIDPNDDEIPNYNTNNDQINEENINTLQQAITQGEYNLRNIVSYIIVDNIKIADLSNANQSNSLSQTKKSSPDKSVDIGDGVSGVGGSSNVGGKSGTSGISPLFNPPKVILKEETNASMRLFKIIFAMSRENFSKYLNPKLKKFIMDNLVKDLKDIFLKSIPQIKSLEDKDKDSIAKFWFGLLGWDLKMLTIGTMGNDKSPNFFMPLYSLIGVKNLYKFYPLTSKGHKQISRSSKILLAYLAPTVAGKSKTGKNLLLMDNMESFDVYLQDKYKKYAIIEEVESFLDEISEEKHDFNWISALTSVFDEDEVSKYIKKQDDSEKLKPWYILKAFLTGEILPVISNIICNKANSEKTIKKDILQHHLSQNQSNEYLQTMLNDLSNQDESEPQEFINSFIKVEIKITQDIHDHDLIKAQKDKAKIIAQKRSKLGLKSKKTIKKMIKKTKDNDIKNEKLDMKFKQIWEFEELNTFFDKFDKRQIGSITDMLSIVKAIVKFYMILSDDSFKGSQFESSGIINIVETFIFRFPEYMELENEEAQILQAISSILLGFSVNTEGFRTDSKPDKIEQFMLFYNRVVLKAFPELGETQFNCNSIQDVLQLINIIKTDFISNLKNPQRLEEILVTLLHLLGDLFKEFNKELAISVIQVAFGKFESVEKIMIEYFTAKNAKPKSLDPKEIANKNPFSKQILGLDLRGNNGGNRGNNSIATLKHQGDMNDPDDNQQQPENPNLNKGNANQAFNGFDNTNKYEQKQHIQKAKTIVGYISGIRNMLDFSPLKAKMPKIDADNSVNIMDPQQWMQILRKVQNGEAEPSDIFQILNRIGGGSGKITPNQFKTLATRLGIKLSDHRISEIIAKVKGTTGSSTGLQKITLSMKDFEKSMVYLMDKSLQNALQMLGITMEQLGILLAQLIFLLILLLIFIFVGIEAFAMGGTFGSVVNSLFPMIGGGSLGKKSDSDKQKLSEDNIANACTQSVALIRVQTDDQE